MIHAPVSYSSKYGQMRSYHPHDVLYREQVKAHYDYVSAKKRVYEEKQKKVKQDMLVRVGFMFNIDDDQSFVIENFLGKGTFGRVVAIKNRKTGEELAMKIIKDEAAYRKQGIQEMRILKEIGKSGEDPRLLPLHSYCELLGQLCLIFPRYQMTLFQLLHERKEPGFKMNQVAHIAKQLMNALSKLRSLNIIHSDVKPDNIMIKNDPSEELLEIVLIDFGSAGYVGQTMSNQYIQSRFYRAPEIILGLNFDNAIDIWSTGCVLTELIFGRPLYPGENELDQLSKIASFQGSVPTEMISAMKPSRVHNLFNISYSPFDGEPFYVVKKDHVHLYWWEDSLHNFCLKENMPRPLPERQEGDEFDEKKIRTVFGNFIEGLLKIDPLKRWTADQALEHPFLECDWSAPMPFVPVPEKSAYYTRPLDYAPKDHMNYKRDPYATTKYRGVAQSRYSSYAEPQVRYSKRSPVQHVSSARSHLAYKPLHRRSDAYSNAYQFYHDVNAY